MIENGKNRHTVWLTDEAWNMVGGEYKADGCSRRMSISKKLSAFILATAKPIAANATSPMRSPMCWKNDWARWVIALENCCSKWRWRSP